MTGNFGHSPTNTNLLSRCVYRIMLLRKNAPCAKRGVRKTVNVNKNSCKAAQGTQSLVRNIMTQNSPDIQVSGLFGLTEHTYGEYLYRSASLHLLEKL